MLKAMFCDHPASVDETYTEHLAAAGGFALRLFVAGLVCSVHAILPSKKGCANARSVSLRCQWWHPSHTSGCVDVAITASRAACMV